MKNKWVYLFSEGNADMRDLLGGKGAGVAEMTRAGVPVPPGFTITTEACNAYFDQGQFPEGLWEQVLVGVQKIEAQTGKIFGNTPTPLLVSVRSGAKFSMPGMMDTVLNLGLNRTTLEGLAGQYGDSNGNRRFAQDAHRRFIQLYSKIVFGINPNRFDHELERLKKGRSDADLSAVELEQLAECFRFIVHQEKQFAFPEDPFEQLKQAITAVFDSWNGRRARDYRRLNKIPDNLGTAVTVQAMVFGNLDMHSATGVSFTRNPNTGEAELFGEYLVNAQGEDVVAGIRTPKPLSTLKEEMPALFEELNDIMDQLEAHYLDMQDVEFTIEQGKLWMLQTRTGKRTGTAAVKIAVDLVHEGLIDRADAIKRITPAQLEQMLYPTLDPATLNNIWPLATGLPASPGAASGTVVFDPDEAEQLAFQGESVILVRTETAPEDLHGMVAAKALLTAQGGRTSHAAVVARSMGKPCVVGTSALAIDYPRQQMVVKGVTVKKGDWLTLDGGSGAIYAGRLPTMQAKPIPEFFTLLAWADEFRTLRVLANADTAEDAKVARQLGAEGIGLCRTEHMFFETDRLRAMREMILAETQSQRKTALAKLQSAQQNDFENLFRAMDGFPVIIRTLDPPLHEFLPNRNTDWQALADELGLSVEKVRGRAESLHEANPMLGFRGCRLGIVYPEITQMQAQAIFRAAARVSREGIGVYPKIMIPLVASVAELRLQEAIVREVACLIEQETGIQVLYQVGTMIELPRAALTADTIAQSAEFFSFGTNDLTQTTMGLSRDDAGRFLPYYVQEKILPEDPFQTIDIEGVGQLVEIGVQRGRMTRPGMEVGICGEHGGDPASIQFFHAVGLDYVSCSPYRVPVARLSAAQAALSERQAVFATSLRRIND